MSTAAVVPRHVVPRARVFEATHPASNARGVRHAASSRLTSPSGYRRHAHRACEARRTTASSRAVGDARGDGREAKPAVAVVKTSACPHCRRAGTALRERASRSSRSTRPPPTARSSTPRAPRPACAPSPRCSSAARAWAARTTSRPRSSPASSPGESSDASADARDARRRTLRAPPPPRRRREGRRAPSTTAEARDRIGSGFGADAAYAILDEPRTDGRRHRDRFPDDAPDDFGRPGLRR